MSKEILSLDRRDIKTVTGLLTGHNHLNRHMELIGITDDPLCRWCLEDDETSSHILTECPALVHQREINLGSIILNPEDVKEIQLRKLLNFVKEIGTPS
ncbi:hypothetical protein JTB14_003148 [Gonioctena quinquepunctata]|nr:hypothetical protein JTB14_003148 [Gonioctena quinquepunctata]